MSTLIEFKNEILDSYLSGFFSMLDNILQKGEDLERIKQESAKESSKNSKRDNLIPIYMYCKNLWDKWLIAGDNTNALPYVNRFTVKEYFKNFLFIDSFYRNVYNLLAVNCQHFINLVEGINKNGGVDSTNLYSFLGNLASKTRCLFVAIPDYINLGTVDNEGKMLDTGIRNMEKIFKPIPLKDMRPIQTDNKFVIIYTHEPSKNKDNKEGFLKDCFDLCDRNGKLTNEAEQCFGGIKLPSEETKRPVGFMGNMDTKAFPVPSFAVAFGGINNHLFQSIDVNMDNPIATEHSINITSQIAQMGSGNSQSIAYQGQDVYPIFSNYAYESKVEMMGNAQIQPLMYYQLMNIPMWKGAYMIFNVQHSITPGNMVTTFRGMKMSKNCVPYLEKWAYPVESPEGMPKLQLVGNDNVSINNESNVSGGQSVITGEHGIVRSTSDGYTDDIVATIKSMVGKGTSKLTTNTKKERGRQLVQTLQKELNWSLIQAAGMVGHLSGESGLDEQATSRTNAAGIAQWTNTGKRRQKAFNSIEGYNYDTMFKPGVPSTYPTYEQQVSALLWELKGTYKKIFVDKYYTNEKIGNDLRYAVEVCCGRFGWLAGFAAMVKGETGNGGQTASGVWKNYENKVCTAYELANMQYP